MAGIAGIAQPGKSWLVTCMLNRMYHRGSSGREISETPQGTMGVIWPQSQSDAGAFLKNSHLALDEAGQGHFALASEGFTLKRDPLGVAPLYYGHTPEGSLCFASEVKALLLATRQVMELPPGHVYEDGVLWAYDALKKQEKISETAEVTAQELRRKLEVAVEKRIGKFEMGVWLSGGLDSSAMAALVKSRVRRLDTFAVGLPGEPDLAYARAVADHLGCKHHEVPVRLKDMLEVLPTVIYHLESFEPLLVRSSVMNFLAAKRASGYVQEVFTGEGGDELFAGYDYLQSFDAINLDDELIDITLRLHHTALQRIDRCAAAFGLVAHNPFLDPDVVAYAFRIPARYKLQDGVEKWIVRQAMAGALPEEILLRPSAKFWEGSGVGDLMTRYAEENITSADFEREKHLPNGWVLNSIEELLYYRLFRECLGNFDDLSWMGRTRVLNHGAR